MQLHINEPIHEDHFQGTFVFPNDLDFLNIESEHQCFVDLFNKEIERRKNNSDLIIGIDINYGTAKMHKPLTETEKERLKAQQDYFKNK